MPRREHAGTPAAQLPSHRSAVRPIVSTAELPEWLGRIAVAETVTGALLSLVAEASGAGVPRDLPALLDLLTADGVLDKDDPDTDSGDFRLTPTIRQAMLEELCRLPGGVHEVRSVLIRVGLAHPRRSLAGQLAIWAHQNADWASLSDVWLAYPSAIWATIPHTVVPVFTHVPAKARQAYPVLTQAAAMTAALDPARAGTYIEQAVGWLRQDGRLLHSGWASLRNPDSALRAGSIWMMAQRTIPGRPDPLEDAWETRKALSALITRQTLAGSPPTSAAQTLFHANSAATALLRGDIFQARSDCEQAMMLSQPGDLWGLLAAGLEALALTIAGNPPGCERAAEWFEAAAPACGPFAEMANPYRQLALALKAIRELDRETATKCLRQAAAMEEGSEFWSAYAWIRSMHDLTCSAAPHRCRRRGSDDRPPQRVHLVHRDVRCAAIRPPPLEPQGRAPRTARPADA